MVPTAPPAPPAWVLLLSPAAPEEEGCTAEVVPTVRCAGPIGSVLLCWVPDGTFDPVPAAAAVAFVLLGAAGVVLEVAGSGTLAVLPCKDCLTAGAAAAGPDALRAG
jgi:hypothetical protein